MHRLSFCRAQRAVRLEIKLKAQTKIPIEEMVSLHNKKVDRAVGSPSV